MAMMVLHTGQTGVERGADRAARAVGMKVGGTCSRERRDELGALPPEVAADLVPCEQRGARSALRATLARAHALVVAVPDVATANASTGIDALRRAARTGGVPHWIIDPSTDLQTIISSLRKLESVTDPLYLMITGPRFTRWLEGERLGWRLIAEISLTPSVTARKHRILVVDEHIDAAQTTCSVLRALGHEAVSATSGMECLALARELAPDVGLFDLELQDIEGCELARRVRWTQPHPMFIVAIAGSTMTSEEQTAVEAAFDELVTRPAGTDVIRAVLDRATRILEA